MKSRLRLKLLRVKRRSGGRWHSGSCRLRAPSRYGVAVQPFPDLLQKTRFVRISGAGLRESHVHDVMITREAPNYAVE